MGTLIVGASQAGLQVAVSLRALGDDQPITLVGAEEHPPYQRPPPVGIVRRWLPGQPYARLEGEGTPEGCVGLHIPAWPE